MMVVSKSVVRRISSQTNRNKPRFGEPCNGCGHCCSSEICKIGKEIYKTDTIPCPGLIMHGGHFGCQLFELVNNEQRPFLKFIMGIGIGCDSN